MWVSNTAAKATGQGVVTISENDSGLQTTSVLHEPSPLFFVLGVGVAQTAVTMS